VTRPRKLTPEEATLWAKVVASVQPYRVKPLVAPVAAAPEQAEPKPTPAKAPRVAPSAPPKHVPKADGLRERATLDATWDRRLSRGLVSPESTIDLHGHNLDSAYQRLDHGLDRAIARGDRVLLLITGRPPRPESERPHARGAIRAAVHDWLGASRHAARIAAVRPAHPAHGGAGALYIVLRRDRARNLPNS
jgi:DNA-nicking Smr family endonuclease